MTPEQYTEAIETVNETLRKSRAGKIDGVLLATGALMLPLALWGVRRRSQTKKRKRLLKEAIHEFNTTYPGLYMRWNRKPQSFLSIELRAQAGVNPSNPASFAGSIPAGFAGAQDDTEYMVQAQVIRGSDTANYQGIQTPPYPQQLPPQQQQPQQPQTMEPPNLL